MQTRTFRFVAPPDGTAPRLDRKAAVVHPQRTQVERHPLWHGAHRSEDPLTFDNTLHENFANK